MPRPVALEAVLPVALPATDAGGRPRAVGADVLLVDAVDLSDLTDRALLMLNNQQSPDRPKTKSRMKTSTEP